MPEEIRGCGKCSNNDGIQNDMWGCSVFCRVRGKTKKRYGDCNHFSENKSETIEEVAELKPCPFCGGKAEISPDGVIGCCHCRGILDGTVEEWNRRTPEPGTSVIHWTRYNGTTGTLPELFSPGSLGRHVLRVIDDVVLPDFLFKGICDGRIIWHRTLKVPVVGDEWAHMPESKEGTQ